MLGSFLDSPTHANKTHFLHVSIGAIHVYYHPTATQLACQFLYKTRDEYYLVFFSLLSLSRNSPISSLYSCTFTLHENILCAVYAWQNIKYFEYKQHVVSWVKYVHVPFFLPTSFLSPFLSYSLSVFLLPFPSPISFLWVLSPLPLFSPFPFSFLILSYLIPSSPFSSTLRTYVSPAVAPV